MEHRGDDIGRTWSRPGQTVLHSPMLGVHGKTAAPVECLRQRPSADEEVRGFADAAHVLLATSERQLVDDADDKGMVAVHVVGPIGELGTNGIVAIVIRIGVGVGVVGQKLQPIREALLTLMTNAS